MDTTTGTPSTPQTPEMKLSAEPGIAGAAITMDGETKRDEALELAVAAMTEQAPSSQSPARPEHKKQLRDRVETRRSDLQNVLAQSKDAVAPEERVRAIETSLQGLEGLVGTGWEHVGEVESAQLSRWLEATQIFVAGTEDSAGADTATSGPPLRWPSHDDGKELPGVAPSPISALV